MIKTVVKSVTFQAWIHAIMHFCNFNINVQPDPVKFLQLTGKVTKVVFDDKKQLRKFNNKVCRLKQVYLFIAKHRRKGIPV